MSIKIVFGCGRSDSYSEQMQVSPSCPCGGHCHIVRVVPSRMPRFTGTCSGPYADFKALEPGVVDVTTAGPLTVKE